MKTPIAGRSDVTEVKWNHFAGLCSILVPIMKQARKRRQSNLPVLYVDMYAGPGVYEDGAIGTPMIFMRTAKAAGLPFEAHLFEVNPEQNLRLREAASQYGATVHAPARWQDSDLRSVLLRSGRNAGRFGLIVADSNGTPDYWPGLSAISRMPGNEMLDVAVSVSCTATKRVPTAHRLSQGISMINKRHWLIRKPVGQWQWTWALGMNYQIGSWKSQGFYHLGSPEGREIMRKLSLTNAELEAEESPMLPGLGGIGVA